MQRKMPYVWRSIAAISALLCLAATGFWAQSFLWSDEIDSMRRGWQSWPQPHAWYRSLWIASDRGELELCTYLGTEYCSSDTSFTLVNPCAAPRFSWRRIRPSQVGYANVIYPRFCGFGFEHDGGLTRIIVPHVTVALPWLLAFFLAFRRMRRATYPAGFCPGCGYDLRASPMRCPECGQSAARKPS